MKGHPDKNVDNAAYAAAMFGRAKDAHDILMDENRPWSKKLPAWPSERHWPSRTSKAFKVSLASDIQGTGVKSKDVFT
eukprot:2028587-Karenia_brevis.AAC.1